MPREPRARGHGDGGVLEVRLLGGVEASWRHRLVRPASTQARALLALLTLRPGQRGREAIAADLWPDGGPSSAAWLRQALWQLRRALADAGADPDVVVDARSDSIGFGLGITVDLDVTAFERCLRAQPTRPEEAIPLYRGELVEGLSLECFARERERLGDLYEDALAEVGLRSIARGDTESARAAALRLIGRDPMREEGHAILIEVYGQAGSRSQVSRQYRRLCRILSLELGVEPLPETEAVYRTALIRTAARSAQSILGPLGGRPTGSQALPAHSR